MLKNTNTRLFLSMKIIMGVLCGLTFLIIIPLLAVQITTNISQKNSTLPKMPFTDYYYCPITDSINGTSYEKGSMALLSSQSYYNIGNEVFVKNQYYEKDSLNIQKSVVIGKITEIVDDKYSVTVSNDNSQVVTVPIEQIAGIATFNILNGGLIYDELSGMRGVLLYGIIPVLFIFLIYFIMKMICIILFNRDVIREQEYESMISAKQKEDAKKSTTEKAPIANATINNASQNTSNTLSNNEPPPQKVAYQTYQNMVSTDDLSVAKKIIKTETIKPFNKEIQANQIGQSPKPPQVSEIKKEPIIVKVGVPIPPVMPITPNLQSPIMQEETKIYQPKTALKSEEIIYTAINSIQPDIQTIAPISQKPLPKIIVEKIDSDEIKSANQLKEVKPIVENISSQPLKEDIKIEPIKSILTNREPSKTDVGIPKTYQNLLTVEDVELTKEPINPKLFKEIQKVENFQNDKTIEENSTSEKDVPVVEVETKIANIFKNDKTSTAKLREKNGLANKTHSVISRDKPTSEDEAKFLSADEIIKLYRETGSITISAEISKEKEKKLDDLAQLYYDNDLENYDNYSDYEKTKEDLKIATK